MVWCKTRTSDLLDTRQPRTVRTERPSAWGVRRFNGRRSKEARLDGQVVWPIAWYRSDGRRARCAARRIRRVYRKGGSREAKRICTRCEVRAECLEYALGSDERFGIWGGLSERERRKLKRRAA